MANQYVLTPMSIENSIRNVIRRIWTTKENPTLMILEDLQDPGNLGTIVRTAEGAGVNAVFMSKETVDIYNPKTIRSTMGSVYRIPTIYIEDTVKLLELFKEKGIKSYAAHLEGKNSYDKEDYCTGTAILFSFLSAHFYGLVFERHRKRT